MFTIDLMSRTPVYEQIIKQVECQILTGIIRPGDKMPSVRSLSINLSVNPNTIQKAYTQLDLMQIIQTVPGKGSYISDKALEMIENNSRKKLDGLDVILRELSLAGVSKAEIMEVVNEVFKYDGGKDIKND